MKMIAYDVDGERYCLSCAERLGIDVTRPRPPSGYGGPVYDNEPREDWGSCSADLLPIDDVET